MASEQQLHRACAPEDVLQGQARMVRCPECGQLEYWTIAEFNTHGKCRKQGGACSKCEAGALA
jgi:hypothetical protein